MSTLTMTEILLCLNDVKLRATYGAVAECIGVIPQAVGQKLGERSPEASWIVSTDGYPTGYKRSEWHPDLLASARVIGTCAELHREVVAWRIRSRSPSM